MLGVWGGRTSAPHPQHWRVTCGRLVNKRIRKREMSSEPLIDPTNLNSYRDVMGEEAEEFIADLIDTYIRNSSELLRDLRQSLNAKDVAACQRASHTLKSTSATLGVTVLTTLSAEVEAISESGSLNGVEEKIARMEAIYPQVKAALLAMRGR